MTRVEAILKDMAENYRKKNADYGNSFDLSIDKHGPIAWIVRTEDKLNRAVTLLSGKKQLVADEAITDTLRDLATYAVMMAAYLEEKEEERLLPNEKPTSSFVSNAKGCINVDLSRDTETVDI